MFARFGLVLGVAVLLGSAAFADKPRRGLTTFAPSTDEVKDLNKRPSKVKGWVEEDPQGSTEFEFPWKQVGGALLCFAIAAPFGWKLYQSTTEEIASTKDQSGPRVRRKLPRDQPPAES